MTSRETLADNIRMLRALNSLSQDELSQICGVHRTYISLIEHEGVSIGMDILDKLAKSLNVSSAWLLTDHKPNKD